MKKNLFFGVKLMQTLTINTQGREELKDITAAIDQVVRGSGIERGICCVYVPHTTAGVTINENADPSVKSDLLMALGKTVPDSLPFRHGEGNSPAHVKTSLMGSSVQVFIEGGRLVLGTWQGIFFCEFDGPRSRRVQVQCLP
jgi:secondary thiamine-phosphate synthase enzyme